MSLVHTLMSSICNSNLLVCHPYATRMFFICHPFVTRTYSYVIGMLFVCIRMSSICHSYILVCHLYVTRMWFYHESFRRGTFSQLDFLSTATLPIYQSVIKGVLHKLQEFFLMDRLLPKSCNICIIYLIQWLYKILSNSYFFG